MAAKAITNPRGAYGATVSGPQIVESFRTSAAVAKGAVVAISVTTGLPTVATAATDSTASLTVGVALAAAASGDQVQVATYGRVTDVPVDGATAVGAILKRSVTVAGRLAATATPAAGEAIGVSLAASSANTTTVWIAKSL